MDVLYGEADAAARARVEAHLAGCAACREEMGELRAVRRDLGAWRLPRGAAGLHPARGGAAALAGRGRAPPRSASARRWASPGTPRSAGRSSRRRPAPAELERRHREEVRALEAALARRPAAPLDSAALLAGLDARIDERLRASEARQVERLDSRLAGWEERADAQRRVDMARVAASLSYLDGRHGQQLARTNELMGYVLEASAQKR